LIFLLIALEESAFQTLKNALHVFENFKVKDQTVSSSKAKKVIAGAAMQKPCLVGSKFKCLRNMDDAKITELLQEVGGGSMSLKDTKLHADEAKAITCLKDHLY